MFKYNHKYASLLDKLRNGEDFISLFNLDTLYSGGWGKSPLPLDIPRLIYHIYNFLYCFTVVCHCIRVMYKFKGKYAE